jgi:hypothetical protein
MTMGKRTSGWGNAAETIEQQEQRELDEERKLVEEFYELVDAATRGDQRAISAIAIALGPTLNREAREALGPRWEQDSADILQEFFLALCEGLMRMPPVPQAAMAWMKRTVRAIAEKWVEEREPPGGMAG